jgi:hypothetical protein
MSRKNPWYIRAARESLEEGFRVIAGTLNEVLRQKAPKAIIRAANRRKTDSLGHAVKQFRRTLTGLRGDLDLPDLDSEVVVWTYGNFDGNDHWRVTAGNPIEVETLDDVRDYLMAKHWKVGVWRKEIKKPVEQLQRFWLSRIDQVSSLSSSADKAQGHSSALPRNPQVLALCRELRKHRHRLAKKEISQRDVARWFVGDTPDADKKVLRLLRQAHRHPRLWRS